VADGLAQRGGSAKVPRVSDVKLHIATSSVTRAMDVIGDRWAVFIMRDAFQGARRYEQFIARTGATRATLANRLRVLVAQGLLERVRYNEAPPRHEYRLTRQGRDLFPVALAAWSWERRWAPRSGSVPAQLRHVRCGHATRPQLVCAACGGALDVRRTLVRKRLPAGPVAAARPALRRLSPSTALTHRGSSEEFSYIADVVGDRWMPLIVSAAFFGQRRFEDIQASLGIASNILTHRLGYLVDLDILERRSYSRHPARSEYRLTRKGRDLFPYAIALMAWGDRWLGGRRAATALLYHADCGERLVPAARCSHCGDDLTIDDVTFRHASRPRQRKE
jgi:DNA-binding HxlR family transcriptional regulator